MWKINVICLGTTVFQVCLPKYGSLSIEAIFVLFIHDQINQHNFELDKHKYSPYQVKPWQNLIYRIPRYY